MTPPPTPIAPRHFAVIGAGIVGVSTALYLQRDGHRVTVIDERPPGEGTSMGNAAVIAAASCEPVAMPGILWRVPGMLRDPLDPLELPAADRPLADSLRRREPPVAGRGHLDRAARAVAALARLLQDADGRG